MKRKLSLILTLLLVLSLMLVGCGKDQDKPSDNTGGEKPSEEKSNIDNPAASRENAENTIILGTAEVKGEFLPVYYSMENDGYVVDYVFDKLMSNDAEGNLTPHVAKEWEISDDNKTYTFYLRDDVKFSDGKPLTAEDVKFTFEIIADPNYDGRYITSAAKLEGYEEYNEGDAKELSGVKVIDDHTVSFTFKEAESTNLLECNYGIMPKHYYDFEKGDIDAIKAKMQDPMGSGPYAMTNYEEKQFIEFEANKEHFLGEPKIPNMLIKFTTAETEIQELEKGTIDVVLGATTTPENKEIIDDMEFLDIHSFINNGYCYLGWNMADPRFAEKEVRQALTYGFNRQGFVDTFFDGHAEVSHVPVSQVSWAYTDELKEGINKYEYDPEKAKELLDKAGWKEGSDGIREKDGQKLEFVFSTYQDVAWIDRLIPMLIDDWSKIGVKVEANMQDSNAVSDMVFQQRDFDLYSMCWQLTVDPDSSSVYHSREIQPGGNNSVSFESEENDKLLDAGVAEFDQEKRKEIYKDWALLVNEELPYMYIYMRENWDVHNVRVKNFNTEPFIKPTHPNVVNEMELVD